MKIKVPRALTVAGSDSGGGAGIQADLKTFAALGVHGMSAITSITAQNTREVTRVVDLEPSFIVDQIRACVEDIGVDAVKTGMLHTSEIIEAVSRELSKIDEPIVVDPVMIAKSGAPLLREDAVETVKKRMIPIAFVVTPNIHEAEALTGMKILDNDSQRKAAKLISEMGARAVVVKGGHMGGDETRDVLYYDGKYREYVARRIDTRSTHGTGCVFASAIAAELAKGSSLEGAVEVAKHFVWDSIRYGLELGKGSGPVNPSWRNLRDAWLYRALNNVRRAVNVLESIEGAGELAPESMINIAEAVPYASERGDVIGVPGRVVKVGESLRASSHPWPGGSRHVADAILELHSIDPRVRSAMNIKFSDELLKAAESAGFSISSYDRSLEPEEYKRVEGMTVRWGVRSAYQAAGKVTDIIYHRGDVGKEPMTLIIGEDSLEVVDKFSKLLKAYKELFK